MAGMAPLSLGRAPWPYVLLLCLLISVAESGGYVAGARAYMIQMDARYRHAYNAVWSAGISLGCGVASVLAGFFVRGGGAGSYILASSANALLMVVAAAGFIRLHEQGHCYDTLQTALFHPRRVLPGVVRIWGYVLRPGPSVVKIGADAAVD
jgi:hypothetical protein